MSDEASTRVRLTENEYGTPVTEYRCASCGELFTICPAAPPEKDWMWRHCMADECASYDPARDANKLFDDGNVLSMQARRTPVYREDTDG